MTRHMDSEFETQLITVHSHGAEYFYYTVHAAFFLSRRLDSDVRVVFIPFETPLRKIVQWLRRPAGGPDHAADVRKPADAGEPFYEKFARRPETALRRRGRRITFAHARVPLYRRVRWAIWSLLAAFRITISCIHRFRFRGGEFLRAEFKQTRIGDLVVSSFERCPYFKDRVVLHPYLFYVLWKACYLVHVAEWLWRRCPGSLTMTPEPSYVHSAAHRFLHGNGAVEVSIHRPCAAHELIPSGGDGRNGRELRREHRPAPDGSYLRDVEAYFETRLRDAKKAFYYMAAGQNDNSADIVLDSHFRPVHLNDTGVYAVVFLQSVMDATNLFGVDGFETVTDWTYHSIDRCLQNDQVEGILVKPHPGADYVAYPRDGLFVAAVKQRYAHNPRVRVLHACASLRRLCTGSRLVGLTKFGSVSEEMVYLGQPVIASRFAPWGDEYRFARTWTTIEGYDQLLEDISPQSWQPPTDEERAELFRYVVDYRLCEVGPEERFPRVMLADLMSRTLDNCPAPLDSPAYRKYERCLDALSESDAMFPLLLDRFDDE